MEINYLASMCRACSGLYQQLERSFDWPFGAAANPWRHLGALAFLFFWIVLVSGCYLYIEIDTSVSGVYRSIGELARQQRYFGGILRSLHRYAADAFILVTLLHLARELLLGHWNNFRRYSWLTGVPLLALIYMSGIVGFWLRWDQLAHYSALATAEWLDSLPVIAASLTRNFLSSATVSDRLFSLFIFIHIGVPLLLLFGLWFHIKRIGSADVFPARPLATGSFATLLVLALAVPVLSDKPADLALVPGPLKLDWFYLYFHPLMATLSADGLWLLLAAATVALFALPWLPHAAARPAAVVHPESCNGCRRCLADCPYAAIVMVPHPSGKSGQQLARVLPDLCAACGICVGSCPSSTPLRGAERLITGIDLAQAPLDGLRRQLETELGRIAPREDAVVVFGCDQGAAVAALAGANVATLSLVCAGMLPPSFIEFALRNGAAGVLVTGCRSGGCAFRLGDKWTEERLAGAREPNLRARVDSARLKIFWADRGEERGLAAALGEFQRNMTTPPQPHAAVK